MTHFAQGHDFAAHMAVVDGFARPDWRATAELLGGSLGGLIEQFFGAGEWSPQPRTWRCEPQTDTSIETPPLRYTDTILSARQR
ncbi:MAG TPA: hypothetical protein VFR59_09120 [Steroidobacteraceae bacterium]|nr:hypothetical protein [Steroidobacteraceae bacterium]